MLCFFFVQLLHENLKNHSVTKQALQRKVPLYPPEAFSFLVTISWKESPVSLGERS